MSEKHELVKSAGTLVTQNDGEGDTKVEVGKVGTMVSGAETVNTTNINNNKVFIVTNSPSASATSEEEELETSKDYFNLFVLGRDAKLPTCNGEFFIPRDRVLEKPYTRPEIIDLVRGFDNESCRRIRSFPTLICTENIGSRKAADSQKIYYGKILDIYTQENGMYFKYYVLNEIMQNKINAIQPELAISSTTYYDEMMRTHWSIKQIDLVRVLKNAGIHVYVLS